MLRTACPRTGGFTLVELMIALGLSATILAAGIGLLVSTLGFNREQLLVTRSRQDLRLLLDLELRDLARAGGWRMAGTVAAISQTHDLLLRAQSGTFTVTAVNPGSSAPAPIFAAPLSNNILAGRRLLIWVSDTAGRTEAYELTILSRPNSSELAVDAGTRNLPVDRIAAGSWTIRNPFAGVRVDAGRCVVFAYDEDGDGQRGAQERYGYRYDVAGSALEGVNNADHCANGSWQNISDERVLRVSSLHIGAVAQASGPGSAGLQSLHLTLAMTAQPRAGDAPEMQLQNDVRVRNDVLQ